MPKDKNKRTNAMRILETSGIPFEVYTYGDGTAISGMEVAAATGQDPDRMFKTLVTMGRSGEHYVFMVPVNMELSLKKAAQTAGEKSIEMIKQKDLLPLTGYVHGGCSPIGMKKSFTTFVHETALLYDRIIFSAGAIGFQVDVPVDKLMSEFGIKDADVAE